MMNKKKWAVASVALCLTVAILFISSGTHVDLDSARIVNYPQMEYVHFSIDDCNGIFQDLTEKQDIYTSIFDNEILGFLKRMHDQYGIVFSLYVFYDWDLAEPGFDLSMSTDKFREEFEANGDWLKFGYHASDAFFYQRNTPEEVTRYYNLTMRELKRIVGDRALYVFIRLDRYPASDEVVQALQNTDNPVRGLLIADRADSATRISYGLSEEERKQCYARDWYCDRNGMLYTPTDIRLEAIDSDDEFYELVNEMYDQKALVIFSHEFEMDKESVRYYCELLAQYVVEYGLKSDYPQNNIG